MQMESDEKKNPEGARAATSGFDKQKGRSNKPRRSRNQVVPNNGWRTAPLNSRGWRTGDRDHDGWLVDREDVGLVDLNDQDNLKKLRMVALRSCDFVHTISTIVSHRDDPNKPYEPVDRMPVVSVEKRIIRKYDLSWNP